MNFSLRNALFSELTFWVILCAVGLYFLLPLRQSLRLGIDLVGGTYLTLQVQTDKAVESELKEELQSIDSRLKKFNKPLPKTKSIEDNTLVLTFDSMQGAQEAASVLKGELKEMKMTAQDVTIKLYFDDQTVERIKKDAVERNIEVLRTRLRDIPVAAQGERNIVVELPDVADPQQAKQKIGKAAQLEFRIVEKRGNSEEDILLDYDGELPADKEILPSDDPREGFYLVEKYPDVTGKYLKEARPVIGGKTGVEPVVLFKFNEVGADKFYNLTSKNYGRQLAIVLDNVIVSAPRINEPIRGEGSITGNFTAEQAKDLSLLLTSGSFVAPVKFAEERQIGPALGAQSIRMGLLSCVVGLALLFIFSIFYYSVSGFFAFLALVYNLGLVLLGLAWLQTPLTLPGIAGMVLTVGMAIDASILIFEHIKDELKRGVSTAKAVKTGFSGAMKVILDANITTFIVGVVLYNFGTGPIQGFAVTMMLGIIATLITGLFFLRSLFTFVLKNFHIQKLRI